VKSVSASPSILAIELALQFSREPLMLKDWLPSMRELPPGIGELIRIAGSEEASLDAQAQHYGVSAGTLIESAQFFLQQVLLRPGADYYRVLGVAPTVDFSLIRGHHRLLMRLLHPDRHAGRECWTDGYATRVNRAYSTLRNTDLRKAYDRSLDAGLRVPGRVDIRPSAQSTARVRPWVQRGTSEGPAAASSFRARLPIFTFVGVFVVAVMFVTLVYLDNHITDLSGMLATESLPVQSPGVQKDGIPSALVETVFTFPDSPLAPSDGGQSSVPAETELEPGGFRAHDEGAPVAMQRTEAGEGPASTRPDHSKAFTNGVPESVDRRAAKPVDVDGARQHQSEQLVHLGAPASTGRSTNAVGVFSGRKAISGDSGLKLPARSAGFGDRPRPSSSVFTESALMALIGQLVHSYQQGNLSAFMSVFAENAKTSDESTPSEIQIQYRRLFDGSERRRLDISHLEWTRYRHRVVGKGNMNVRVWRNGVKEQYYGEFSIEIVSQYQQKTLGIVGLYYDLGRR
jgi:hypothetical protein